MSPRTPTRPLRAPAAGAVAVRAVAARAVAVLGLLVVPAAGLLASCAAGPPAATRAAGGAVGGAVDGAVDGAVVAGPAPAGPGSRAVAVRAAASGTPAAASTTVPTSAAPSGTGPRTASPTGSPTAAGPCIPLYGPGTPVPVNLTTTGGAVVMSWWHNGDPAAIAYWIGVQPRTWATPVAPGGDLSAVPVAWTRVPPPTGCRTVTVTVPGIVRGTDYSVLFDLEARTPETKAGVSRRNLNHVLHVRLP